MNIDCYNCETKVNAKVIAEHISLGDYETGEPPYKVVLLECIVCKHTLVGGHFTDSTGDSFDWSEFSRLWPLPDKYISEDIPVIVRKSLEEAKKCYQAKSYIACAVMCGSVLEGVCLNFRTKNKYLAGGLKELLENEVIDKRIFTWSEELRKHRNIGAHISDENITKEDAKDLLDFASAICEYIFILTSRFEKFMKRKDLKKSLSI